MSTKLEMLATIREELRIGTRFDSYLPKAITAAIKSYRAQRFSWAESRSECLFNTVANTEFYDENSAGASALGRLISIDYAFAMIGTQPYQLMSQRPAEAEQLSNSTTFGQPSRYIWYGEQLRLYPVPGGVFPIRIAGLFVKAEPATDVETGNPWMTKAEVLIRSRAKAEIALHRMRDRVLAEDMMAAAGSALAELRNETTSKTSQGRVESFW